MGKVYMLSRNRREASDKPNVSFPKCVEHVMLGFVWMVFSFQNNHSQSVSSSHILFGWSKSQAKGASVIFGIGLGHKGTV